MCGEYIEYKGEGKGMIKLWIILKRESFKRRSEDYFVRLFTDERMHCGIDTKMERRGATKTNNKHVQSDQIKAATCNAIAKLLVAIQTDTGVDR